MNSINAYSLKIEKKLTKDSKQKVNQKLLDITESYKSWCNTTFARRVKLLRNLAGELKNNSNFYAKIATEEMGKPISQAVAEVEKCAWLCEYYAEHGESFLQDEELETDYHQTIVTYEPLGAVLGIMPWNYPYWQVFRFAVPTITAGNVAILKHASNVPRCALAIEEMFYKADFPQNIFTTLLVDSEQIESIIQSDIVQAISLTGSEKAGASVSSQAAKVIKKSVLELGGSDAFIVLDDADIELTVEQAVIGRFQNNGQSCIASKRFIIHEKVYDDFMKKFSKKVESLKIGDPMDENNYIGPMAKKSFVNDIDEQVKKSVKKGAKILTGGKIYGEKENFYLPTILENVKPGMPAFDEEIFGPVAACMKFKKVEEAIEIANNSIFGLGGTIWTRDTKKAFEIARKINTGTVTVNDIVKSDPRIPFGGVKKSGFGRELAKSGIREFVNQKAINIHKLQ